MSDPSGEQLHLTVPEGMQVRVDISSLNVKRGSALFVDGREIEPAKIPLYLQLSNGTHKIQFTGSH
jgi:hypothetical protein